MSRYKEIMYFLFIMVISLSEALAQDLPTEKIGEIIGVKATTTNDGVVRVGWPRTDVKVHVDGLEMHPFMGVGSWAAFIPTSHGAMMMGDTVVFEDEVNPALDAALAQGLEVTALHNHFFFDEPKVYFMHIGGNGTVEELAEGVKAVWGAIKDVRQQSPQPMNRFEGEIPKENSLNVQTIDDILGHTGTLQDGIYKVVVGREAEMHGTSFGAGMGLSTWMAFAGTDEIAVVDGDFAMQGEEVQKVLKALREGDIKVVALHNHMIGEKPAYFFVHFWGKGRVEELTRTLKTALDHTSSP